MMWIISGYTHGASDHSEKSYPANHMKKQVVKTAETDHNWRFTGIDSASVRGLIPEPAFQTLAQSNELLKRKLYIIKICI